MSRIARELVQATSLGMSPARKYDLARQLDAWYGAPGRHYHTLKHIKNSFEWLEHAIDGPSANAPKDPTSLRVAVLFHDAIYEPGRSDNEQASSLLAQAFLARVQEHGEGGIEPVSPERVDRLILLTALHSDALNTTSLDSDERLMLDIDLAILAARESDYQSYAQGVAREYASVATPERYKKGRAVFLRGMIAQPVIYRTVLLGAEAEARARRNMEQELSLLEETQR